MRGKPECAALSGLAGHAHLAPHYVCQPLADGEAEPGSAIFSRGGAVGLLKRLKQPGDLILAHAYAAILNFKPQQGDIIAFTFLSYANANLALLRKLDG